MTNKGRIQKKFKKSQISFEILRCPFCHSEKSIDEYLNCAICGKKYQYYKGVPILLNKPYDSYQGLESQYEKLFLNAKIFTPYEFKNESYNRWLICDSKEKRIQNLLKIKYEYEFKLCKFVLNFFSKYIIKGKKYNILNIGSGLGTYDHVILDNHPNCNILGVELIRNGAAKSQQFFGNDNLNYICADGTNLPLNANFFDFIYTKNTIEHAGISMVKEIYRILKPGGKAIIMGPGFIHVFTRSPFQIYIFILCLLNRTKYKFHGYRVSEYKRYFKLTGFKILKHDAYCFNTKQRSPKLGSTLLKLILFFNNSIEWLLKKAKLISFLWIQVFILKKPKN